MAWLPETVPHSLFEGLRRAAVCLLAGVNLWLLCARWKEPWPEPAVQEDPEALRAELRRRPAQVAERRTGRTPARRPPLPAGSFASKAAYHGAVVGGALARLD